MKKILCSVFALVAASASFLAMGNAAAAVADPDEISIQEIDQYLLKHGYPTEFIQDAA